MTVAGVAQATYHLAGSPSDGCDMNVICTSPPSTMTANRVQFDNGYVLDLAGIQVASVNETIGSSVMFWLSSLPGTGSSVTQGISGPSVFAIVACAGQGSVTASTVTIELDCSATPGSAYSTSTTTTLPTGNGGISILGVSLAVVTGTLFPYPPELSLAVISTGSQYVQNLVVYLNGEDIGSPPTGSQFAPGMAFYTSLTVWSSTLQVNPGDAYHVTVVASFSDGSEASATTSVVAVSCASPLDCPLLATTTTTGTQSQSSAPENPPSLEIFEFPSVTTVSIPYTVNFVATPAGGSPSYSITWSICRTSGGDCFTSNSNPLEYTFKYASDYTVTARVVDAKGQTSKSAPITIVASASRYRLDLSFLEGGGTTDFLTGKFSPFIQFVGGDQDGLGVLSATDSSTTLQVETKINWGGVVLPDWASSFLGYSYPWYTMVVEGQGRSGTVSVDATPAIQLDTTYFQLGPGGTTTVYADATNLGLSPGPNGLLWQNLKFTVSPSTPLALALDLVAAVFAALGLTDLIPSELTADIATYLAQMFLSDLLQIPSQVSSSTFSQQFADLLSRMLDTLSNLLLDLEFSVLGSGLRDALALSSAKAAQLAAEAIGLGTFLYDMVTLTAVLVKGSVSDSYKIAKITPMLSVEIDPNVTLDSLLTSAAGSFGYSGGHWVNSANASGFVHTGVSNGTYGYAIPFSTSAGRMNLTLKSLADTTVPYHVVILLGTDTTVFDGSLGPQDVRSLPIVISNGRLATGSTGPALDYPVLAVGIAVAGVMSAGVYILLKKHKSLNPKTPTVNAVRAHGAAESGLSESQH